jgi:HSP20 family molecular chaperone IbpA
MPVMTAGAFGNYNPQVSKMMEQLSKGYYGFMPSEIFTPNVNLYETETQYQVCVDLAGVEKDKIDIVVVDQRLTIRGNRPVPPCPAQAGCDEAENVRMRVHLMEIDHGAFAREVELPDNVIKDQITAKYVDGFLWILLPKK